MMRWITTALLVLCLLSATAFAENDKASLNAALDEALQVPPDLVVPDVPEVAAEIAQIVGEQRKGLEATLARSGRYVSAIEAKLAAKKLPRGLVALAMQESAFRPDAVSRTGAAGLWQFKPATARLLRMRRDAFVDSRFDFETATDRAADYLADLYSEFEDWDFAMAAYNWGRGAVASCRVANPGKSFWTLVREGKVRDETAKYVPRIYALLTILRDPQKHGFEPPKDDAPVTVKLPPLCDLAALEKEATIESGALRALNPQLRTGYAPPYDAYRTVYATPEMKAAIEKLSADAKLQALTGKPGKLRGLSRIQVTIAKGHTLWSLSRTYDTSVESILEYNGWTATPTLSVGDKVMIYKKTE